MMKRNMFVVVGLGLVLTSSSGCASDDGGGGGSAATDPLEVCADVCDKLTTLGCSEGGPNCTPECEATFAATVPECQDEVLAYLSCVAENATTCSKPEVCSALLKSTDTCQAM